MDVKKRWIVTLAALALAAVAAWAIFAQNAMAPEVTVAGLRGERLSLSGFKGKVVLVNFWATTCTTCVGEMPQLVALREKYAGQGYETLAIAMDYDPPEYVKAFVAKTGLPFPVGMDSDGSAARAFGGVRLTPTSYLVDRQGRIVQQYLGAPDFGRLEALVVELLKAGR